MIRKYASSRVTGQGYQVDKVCMNHAVNIAVKRLFRICGVGSNLGHRCHINHHKISVPLSVLRIRFHVVPKIAVYRSVCLYFLPTTLALPLI